MATRRTIQIHSMTGFANAAGECGGKRINLEIRAVNHRYLMFNPYAGRIALFGRRVARDCRGCGAR